MKYEARINGKPAAFEAANDNHAIRRIVVTLQKTGPVYGSAQVWTGDRAVARISLSKALGGSIWINDTEYDKRTWRESLEQPEEE